jgi:PAS domain S-box-containing protein
MLPAAVALTAPRICTCVGSLKLLLSEKKKKITKRNADIMDTMIDAVITIDPKGKILVFNKKAEEIFGYRKKQVLKKNVNMLMPPDVALSHDGYLKTYKRTKKRHIIGIGRQVNARHSDGHEFPIHLSISESKTNDETLFTATIRLITAEATREAAAVESASTGGVSTASPSDMAMFGLLDCLLDATVVINQNGIIKFWNKAASERLGFSKEEVVGKNIKMCMPASIAGKTPRTSVPVPVRVCVCVRVRLLTTALPIERVQINTTAIFSGTWQRVRARWSESAATWWPRRRTARSCRCICRSPNSRSDPISATSPA